MQNNSIFTLGDNKTYHILSYLCPGKPPTLSQRNDTIPIMRKFIRLALTLIIATLSTGSISAQFRYGATIGTDFSNLKFKQDLITIGQATGFEAGVTTETMYPGIGFGIGSGLIYTMRGANLHLGDKKIWASEGYGKERSYLHYIEIPLNLRFKWTRMSGLEDYIAPLIYGGPTVSVLVGHSHIPALSYAAADIGLEVGFGFELFKNWQITAVRNWGVTYALKTKLLDDFSAQNRTWSIRITYFLKR